MWSRGCQDVDSGGKGRKRSRFLPQASRSKGVRGCLQLEAPASSSRPTTTADETNTTAEGSTACLATRTP